ncbi:hypothetical protein A3E45_02935 [Candidatus Daviesbacteria bacterium RIFCSPHIGHO2_12_FULL_43_11]|uniref:DUF192 domain-containing protein n=2 Tax=Candidatus Daviesiibacteriota TaxID=1752718 RepID=A0A1F5K0J8_9BACT|nr:MAG: hypothetical protein A2874_01010 [Candidatus Daviesbacteria bacterium RIFCSPHIGHO2_01_FULL_43_17]OGE34406.1 MAG: hypothetical protein A3E45_02935 [Candidatus Daviesbacteria bacterium RIFCSPHIGHO2_12_FULL_43_11]OGE70806.1 MAG: hypothetical protein A3J21_00920 [Candidatus Daviesbacteria bacterium RIFCSPLOWO2_02_FULL_43_11]
MKIFNQTKDTWISENIREAVSFSESFSDRLLGMLKTSHIGGVMLKTRFGIHTFFMKNPIDVVVLDNNFKVVKISTVKPNCLFFWNPKYFLVLELSQGTVKKTKTEIGNYLKITP